MRARLMSRSRSSRTGLLLLGSLGLVLALAENLRAWCFSRPDWRQSVLSARRELGQDLFERQWSPGDLRSHGGDGLGPVFNERSCLGCHNQGGIGGGGPNEKNVDVVTLTSSRRGVGLVNAIWVNPGFRDRSSVVLHKFGDDPRYESYRRLVLAHDTRGRRVTTVATSFVRVKRSQRSTPALFGDGVIDSIPEAVLEAQAKEEHKDFPEIKGRLARDGDGRIGRFGWKGQTASLSAFVADACANELGLELPDRHQGLLPMSPHRVAPGLDLTAVERDALTDFVAALPTPRATRPDHEAMRGKALFAAIGCTSCHVPDLGPAKGIHSDLMLHHMGTDGTDFGGGYGTFLPEAAPTESTDPARRPAGPGEWRTPPLWGVATSAPYLHDGRAPTLDRAIVLHGGEASATAGRYNKLTPASRAAIVAYLKTFTGPNGVSTAKPSVPDRLDPGALVAGMRGRSQR